jgi:Bacterial sugar transferase
MLLRRAHLDLKLRHPRRSSLGMRRVLTGRPRRTATAIWPIDPAVSQQPEGSPDCHTGNELAVELTHDVDGLDRPVRFCGLAEPRRSGTNKRPLKLNKCRSMHRNFEVRFLEFEHPNASGRLGLRIKDDPPGTPHVRFGGQYRFDEMPPLQTVLACQMTQVGSRHHSVPKSIKTSRCCAVASRSSPAVRAFGSSTDAMRSTSRNDRSFIGPKETTGRIGRTSRSWSGRSPWASSALVRAEFPRRSWRLTQVNLMSDGKTKTLSLSGSGGHWAQVPRLRNTPTNSDVVSATVDRGFCLETFGLRLITFAFEMPADWPPAVIGAVPPMWSLMRSNRTRLRLVARERLPQLSFRCCELRLTLRRNGVTAGASGEPTWAGCDCRRQHIGTQFSVRIVVVMVQRVVDCGVAIE